MKRIFIVLLLIIFSSSFSLAKDNKRITLEDIKNTLEYEGRVLSWKRSAEVKKNTENWNDYFVRIKETYLLKREANLEKKERDKKDVERLRKELLETKKKNETWEEFAKRTESKKEKVKVLKAPKWNEIQNVQEYDKRWFEYKIEANKTPRFKNRGIARCLYNIDASNDKKCHTKVMRAVFTYSEKSKKRRPGDIFYSLDAIKRFVDDDTNTNKYIQSLAYSNGVVYFKNRYKRAILTEKYALNSAGDNNFPLMACLARGKSGEILCQTFKKSTYKKIEKFIKDPSNEKVLGHSFIKYIKNIRMTQNIRKKIGTDNYLLLGDMMNAAVGDVKKNNLSPDLQKRRVLLKKYTLILLNIKKKLDEEKYKSIDKDISKLSKTYKDLNTLTAINNKSVMNIDEAINVIFDTNKLVQNSALNAKNTPDERLLAQSSIVFIQSLIDSILSTIPEKYYAEPQELPQDFFSKTELAELENIIDSITNNNKKIKSAELNKSMDIINKYINTSKILKRLNDLGIQNSIDRDITLNKASKIATQQIRDNLDGDILKSVKKMVNNMDKNELSNLTKEASSIASEVASSSSVKDTVSVSAVDREYGGQNLKKLIGAARR